MGAKRAPNSEGCLRPFELSKHLPVTQFEEQIELVPGNSVLKVSSRLRQHALWHSRLVHSRLNRHELVRYLRRQPSARFQLHHNGFRNSFVLGGQVLQKFVPLMYQLVVGWRVVCGILVSRRLLR